MAENYYYSSLSGDEIEQTLLGAVRFNTDQNLTTSQKAAARANIGAGEANATFKVLGYFNTLAEMQAALQTLPKLGDAYGIGTESPYDVYVYAMHMVDGQAVPGWVNQGPIDTSAAAFDDEDISVRTGWTSSKIASELTNVQRRLVIDDAPTLGSGNPVASGGVAAKMEWKKIVSENVPVPVNRWTSSTKHDGYGFRAQIPIENVTADMIPEVVLGQSEVSAGTFASIAETYNGGVYIYASEIPSAAITIPTIIVWRGDTGDGSDIPVIRVDPTLTVSGAAADAKAAGDAIRANTTAIDALQTAVGGKAGALIDTASGAIASFTPDATIDHLFGLEVAIEPVQAGSGDPSPDNVRPISGWDAVEVGLTDEQYFDPTATVIGRSWTGGAAADRAVNEFPVNGGETLKLYANQAVVDTFSQVLAIQMQGYTQIVNQTIVSGLNTLTLRNNCNKVIIQFAKNGDITASDFAGTVISVSERINRYTITLGQTVYGGTLDVTAGTMTVDRAMVTYSDSTGFVAHYSNRFYHEGLPAGEDHDRRTKAISNQAKYRDYPDVYEPYFSFGSAGVYINKLSADETLAQFSARLSANPFQICYYLSTPITITLDPVTIATIANQINNVWADAGNVDITYAADIKAYIDRMNQPTEDDMIANTLIAANKYFTINNKLYLSTASIAAGAQIIPGHNCTETNLAAALNALNA